MRRHLCAPQIYTRVLERDADIHFRSPRRKELKEEEGLVKREGEMGSRGVGENCGVQREEGFFRRRGEKVLSDLVREHFGFLSTAAPVRYHRTCVEVSALIFVTNVPSLQYRNQTRLPTWAKIN